MPRLFFERLFLERLFSERHIFESCSKKSRSTILGEGERAKLGEGERAKLGEGCPKVRLSQDRMTILSFHLAYSEGKRLS